jgi:hypothetical protein
MAESDITAIIVAIAALVSSVTVGVLSAFFNKRNDTELKRLDFQNEEKLKNSEFRNEEKLKRLEFENEEKLKISERRNQESLKRLEFELETKRGERDARRDYEFEAKKRLYDELEPLLFLLVEHSENAYHHICELADMARWGSLSVELSKPLETDDNNYYLKATIFKLMLPMGIFRLMQRRLTSYDLQLEKYIEVNYLLTKCLYFTCADDYNVAIADKENSRGCLFCGFENLKLEQEEKDRPHPHHIVYNILGITRGIIDNLADSLILWDDNDKTYHVASFSEFEKRLYEKVYVKPSPIGKICEIFSNFSPNNNYQKYLLLWRILTVEAYIYWIIMKIQKLKDRMPEYFIEKQDRKGMIVDEIMTIINDFKKKEVKNLSWIVEDERRKPSHKSIRDMENDFEVSLSAIESYLSCWLKHNFKNLQI